MKVALDKQAHALGGAVVVLALSMVHQPIWLCLSVCTCIAAAKEIYDSAHPENHTADMWDFVTTCLGGVLAGFYAAGVA